MQDLCPGRHVEHIQMTYDAAVYAVIFDALSHPGPADASRLDQSACLAYAMSGVDTAEAARRTIEIDRDLMILTGEQHTKAEPALAPYAQ